MTKVDVANVMQVVANFCVVAGILLLAMEVRQNNELLGVQLRANYIERVLGTTDIVLQDPGLIELLGKDRASLSEAECNRLILLGIRVLSTFQSAWNEAERGFEDEARLRRAVLAIWSRPTLNYAVPLAWETFRERGDPTFVEWIEREIIPAATHRKEQQ